MMKRPPAFQFYARDWLSNTMGMSMHHRGIYITLKAAMWNAEEPGTLPLPLEIAARSAGLDPRSLRDFVSKSPGCLVEVEAKSLGLPVEAGSKLVDLQLRSQWEEMQQHKQKLSDAGKRGNEKRWEQSSGGDSGGDRSASASSSSSALEAVRTDSAKHIESPPRAPEKPVQPSTSFKELATKKKHTAPSWVKGELLEDLYRGIHHHKIAAAFFDSRHLSPHDQVAECIKAAVTGLMIARVRRLKSLNAAEIEARAFQELIRGLETLACVRDFNTRRQQTTRAVTRVVVEQVARMLETT